MLRTIVLPILAGAVAMVLWVSQCSGPRPTVIGSPEVDAPTQPGDPYRVRASVKNDGPGHGEVKVTVRLLDPATGAAYQHDESLELERGETANVAVEISAPPGAYQPDISVEYPPA